MHKPDLIAYFGWAIIGVSTLDLVPIQITLIQIKLVRIGYTLRPHMNRITLVCIPSHCFGLKRVIINYRNSN